MAQAEEAASLEGGRNDSTESARSEKKEQGRLGDLVQRIICSNIQKDQVRSEGASLSSVSQLCESLALQGSRCPNKTSLWQKQTQTEGSGQGPAQLLEAPEHSLFVVFFRSYDLNITLGLQLYADLLKLLFNPHLLV